MSNYDDDAVGTRQKLNSISPSMCMAKWLQVSLHLPQGRTHSCYHPPTHPIPLEELKKNPNALHNTQFKLEERRQMKNGTRPEGCQYCWNVEDAPNPPAGGRLSDRHYRSSEWWVKDAWDEVVNNPWDHDITPRYVEVNFNQACNFKCSYCSPHLSTAWEDDINEHGGFRFSNGTGHNDVDYLRKTGLMPLEVARKDNPYVDAFWKWWPDVYPNLKVFRMTGGEPLMDKNTFKVLDYVVENPSPDLELSITSNMCPPNQALFDKFLTKIKELEAPVTPDVMQDWTDKGIVKTIKYYAHNETRQLINNKNHWKDWPRYIIVDNDEQTQEFTAIDTETPVINRDDIEVTFDKNGLCTKTGDFIYELVWMKPIGTDKWQCLGSFEEKREGNRGVFKQIPRIKNFMLFVSVDSIGKQAEYLRDGLDFDVMKKNIETILDETENVSITFINTFTLLSISNLNGFLKMILELREKYGYDNQTQRGFAKHKQRIWFDIPYLRYPDWMTIQLADPIMLDTIQSNIDFMRENVLPNDLYGKSYKGFKNYEVLKLERDLAWAKEGLNMSDRELSEKLIRFYDYFKEYDRRRGLNFLETFPEMTDFWNEAKEEKEAKYGS